MANNLKLLDTEKQQLIDLTKQNIAKAGGDRTAGIKATQDYLASQKTASGQSVLDVASQRYQNEQTGNVGLNTKTSTPTTTTQNGGVYTIPGVNDNASYGIPATGTPTTGNTGSSGGNVGDSTGEYDPFAVYKQQISDLQTKNKAQETAYENLYNKGAEGQLKAGVGGQSTGTGLDIYTSTASELQKNLNAEIEALNQKKARLSTALTSTGDLTDTEKKSVLDPYNQFLDKVSQLQEINKQASQREQEAIKTNYNQTIDRQKKANEIALTNAQKIAAITGVGFTSGGVQGISNIIDEGNQAITYLEQARETMLSRYKEADSKLDIEYLDTLTTIQKESTKALQDRYNSVITQIQQIDADKGKATKEGLTAIKDVAKEYFDALDKQWNKDYKLMEFNYNAFLKYKQDLKDEEKITRDQQQKDLELLQKGDLTGLTDEDISKLGQEMDLDKGTLQGLILIREQQKRQNALEQQKLSELTPYQKAQLELDKRKASLDEAKFQAEQGGTDATITPSGTYNDLTYTNIGGTQKPIKVDSVASSSLQSALSQIGEGNIIIADSFRDSTRQQALYDELSAKGATVAKPGTSNHEKGLAVDIYSGKDTNGKLLAPTPEQVKIMNDNGWFQTAGEDDKGHFDYKGITKIGDADIRTFNDLTPSEKAKKQNNPKFIEFVKKQNEVYENPDTKIDDILKYSAGGDDLGETSIQQLGKFNQALSQVGELSKKITTTTTGPIIGTLRSYNPYDANAQALKAEINSLIPNIARGVYGEVGVLTDADIQNYAKTIPNIKSTEDTNKLVLAMTLKTMMNGYKGQLQTLAGAGKDVSKLQGKYKEYEKQVDTLLKSIGGNTGTTPNSSPTKGRWGG